uniref:Transmembrane protein n=1 Tax=Magnetococcus massalia (strain MO-1) TaxID=451514 RepID=A0A1S7LJF7_MAGMO|nr:conserved protein of unknown function [Candidatus Magnetococcus massalia]
MVSVQDVIRFWFESLSPSDWFRKSHGLDARIRGRFMDSHRMITAGELASWRQQPLGWLAQVIVLDQFSRNMFRDTPGAFASDPLALALSQIALAQGVANELSGVQRKFLYMPFMHSESLTVQDEGLGLFAALDEERTLYFAQQHREIIARFGRFPHRNAILGRASTAEELAFLKQPGSSF